MNAKRLFAVVLFLSTVLSLASATTTNARPNAVKAVSAQTASQSKVAEGPIPVPLCDPNVKTCPSLPPYTGYTVKQNLSIAEGPIPVPLCDPNVKTCPSLPPYTGYALKQNLRIAEGPIPVPLCDPNVKTCPSLPPYTGMLPQPISQEAL